MQFKGKLKDVTRDWITGNYVVSFSLDEGNIQEVNEIKDKDLSVEAKKYRHHRSKDANAYAWVLIQKIAEATHSTKDEVYLECLRRYSRAFTHVIVKENAVETMKSLYRTCVDLGEIEIGGMKGHQLQVYYGSSTFDTKEMSVFIEGIVNEAKELNIETLTPRELEEMEKVWNSSQKASLQKT